MAVYCAAQTCRGLQGSQYLATPRWALPDIRWFLNSAHRLVKELLYTYCMKRVTETTHLALKTV